MLASFNLESLTFLNANEAVRRKYRKSEVIYRRHAEVGSPHLHRCIPPLAGRLEEFAHQRSLLIYIWSLYQLPTEICWYPMLSFDTVPFGIPLLIFLAK